MDTSLNKSPKKRKSLGNQNKTPAKLTKLEDGSAKAKTPKESKTPKNATPLLQKGSELGSQKKEVKNKTPKKPQNSESLNGKSATKLNKFKGTKSLEGKKPLNKRDYLVKKLNERTETEGKEAVIKSLNEKIDQILARPEVTKTAKRKLKNYQRLIKIVSGEEAVIPEKSVSKVNAKPQQKAKPVKAKEDKPKVNSSKKEKPVQLEKEEEEDEESDDSDYVVEESLKNVKKSKDSVVDESKDDEDDDEEESDDEDEEIEGEDGESEEEEDEESGDEEEESGDEEEESGEEEEKSDEGEPKKVIQKKPIQKESKPAKKVEQANSDDKKSRYVLFIGNIAYDTTKQELEQHFERIGEVVDVRIPTDKESNRPRGFAYVELANEAAYQKALDLNGSQLKNRKIKVEYTQGGKKNSDDKKAFIKAKNFKLHGMRQQGKFGGGNKGGFKGGFKGGNRSK